MSNTDEPYLLSHEVAQLLQVSTQTIYNWLRTNRIPEPKRHPITRYRQWTPQDVQRIRQIVTEEQH